MTEHERLMYRVLCQISAADTPIVFKGALITKLILAERGFTDLERETNDIDANWIGSPPSMGVLVETLNSSLGELRSQFYAVAFREYEEQRSAGISILRNDTDEEVMLMDISIKPVIGSRVYHYGEAKIRGVLANEILADKISVMSKRLIFRRAKDLVDVYALAHCVKVQTHEIFDIYKNSPNREVGTFNEFYNRRSDVEHAYNKLTGIEGKPVFGNVYAYLSRFIQPFAARDESQKLWNSDSLSWDNPCLEVGSTGKPSVIEEIYAAKKEKRCNLSRNSAKEIRKNEPEL